VRDGWAEAAHLYSANLPIRREDLAGVRIEHTEIVKAPRELVFKAWTDYEAWPRFSGLFTRVTVKERVGNTVHIDAETKVIGRKVARSEKHVLTPPEQVRVEGETAGATNRTLWTFQAVPEGTRVTAAIDAELSGLTRLLGPFAKRQVLTLLREWMQGLARYVDDK
jgi:uncharacterized protein YndB with AHSA1/START domain